MQKEIVRFTGIALCLFNALVTSVIIGLSLMPSFAANPESKNNSTKVGLDSKNVTNASQIEYDKLLLEKKKRQISRDERYDEAWIKLREDEFVHRMDVFKFQYWTSLCIFLVVIMLVIGGFILSWKQFELDSKLGNSGSENAFEISKSGVKFRSSVIGLSIMFLSLGFFYMYIKEVYPVNTVQHDAIHHEINESD